MSGFKNMMIVMTFAAGLFLAMTCAAFGEAAVPAEVEDHGVPIVYVNVDETTPDENGNIVTIEDMNTSPNHEVKCTGTVDIKVPEGYKCDFGDGPFESLQGLTLKYIRGRGNSTWSFDKKPYKIKFTDAQDLFGMGADTEWALMANQADKSLLNNTMTYWLGDQMGLAFPVKGIPVDLVMTGDSDKYGSKYLGSYVLSALVNRGESRVNIDKLGKKVEATEAEAPDGENISGGYLLSMYNEYQDADEPSENLFHTENGVSFINKYPDYELEEGKVLTAGQEKQKDYINKYMQDIEDIVMADEIDHDALAEKMDLQSAADYWLIQEFSHNGDAFQTHSTYLYKPRNGKLFWGPLWDFDLAYCLEEFAEQDDPEAETKDFKFNYTQMLWLDRLRAFDPEFRQLIQERWLVMKEKLQDLTKAGGKLDQYEDEITLTWNANKEIWPDDFTEEDTCHDIIDGLRKYINLREAEYDKQMDTELGKVYVTATFMADGEVLYQNDKVRMGSLFSDVPEEPGKDGYVFAGWYTESGQALTDFEFMEDMVFMPEYVPEEDARLAEAIYFRVYEDWVPLQDTQYPLSDISLYPEDATDSRLKITSSDESIATVNGDLLDLHDTGDIVITATAHNGISSQMTLHIYDGNEISKAIPTAVTARESSFTMDKKEMRQILLDIKPQGVPLDYFNFYFSSTNDKVAEVNYMGVVTAKKAGTAKIKFEVLDENEDPYCKGTMTVTVKKSANTLQAAGRTVNVKAGKLKKKAKVIKRKKAIKVSKAKGKTTYKLVQGNRHKFQVNKKTGNITVKKGLKKGDYTITVKVRAKGSKQYKPANKRVEVKIIVN